MNERLDMRSMNMIENNVDYIADRFPNVIQNGKINFDLLKKELSTDIESNIKEKYELTWVGKNNAKIIANKQITKTLRPNKDKSENFDNTSNIYIEGDNLDVLKILQESYLNKIKCIYIDPPYNTGNDFIYKDEFKKESNEELEDSGQIDENSFKLVSNPNSNGRFHSDWMSMMYSRLKLARNLLSSDGVIFISIGDELYNLTQICNEIYGERNHVGTISRLMKSGGNKGQYFSPNIEYILVYAKNIDKLGYFREELSEDIVKSYNNIDENGERYTIKGLCQPGLGNRANQRYWIKCPDGSYVIPRGKNFPSKLEEGEKITPTDDDTSWKWTYERYKEELKKGNILFKKSSSATALVDENGNTSKWNVFNKIWLKDRLNEGRVPVDFITKYENRISSEELKKLNIPFDFAKPTGLIKTLISYVENTKDSIILDFFSGSATTADAIFQLNQKDNGKRKFIMVQLPEKINEDTDAFKNGYKTICEIGEERIRRAGKKIKEETNADIDYGFRVYKVDSSNMKDIYYEPSKLNQTQLNMFESNIKEDRTAEDLLTQVILDLGLTLDLRIEEKNILNNKVYYVAENSLVACFDNEINIDILNQICEIKPLKVVFRESSFRNDSDKINAYERIKKLSPETEISVI